MADKLPPALAFGELDEGDEVSVDGVDAARSNQSEEVKRTAVRFYLPARTRQSRIGVEASVGYGRRDAYKILHNDASRPKIEVADLAVAHLALGQPDAETRSFEERA